MWLQIKEKQEIKWRTWNFKAKIKRTNYVLLSHFVKCNLFFHLSRGRSSNVICFLTDLHLWGHLAMKCTKIQQLPHFIIKHVRIVKGTAARRQIQHAHQKSMELDLFGLSCHFCYLFYTSSIIMLPTCHFVSIV